MRVAPDFRDTGPLHSSRYAERTFPTVRTWLSSVGSLTQHGESGSSTSDSAGRGRWESSAPHTCHTVSQLVRGMSAPRPSTARLPILRHVPRHTRRSDCVSSYDEYRRLRRTDRDAYVGQFRFVGIAQQLPVRASLRSGVHPNPAAQRQFHGGDVPPCEEGLPARRSTKMSRPSWEHPPCTRPRRAGVTEHPRLANVPQRDPDDVARAMVGCARVRCRIGRPGDCASSVTTPPATPAPGRRRTPRLSARRQPRH